MSACVYVRTCVCVCVFYVRITDALETYEDRTKMQTSGHLHALNTSPPGQQPRYPPNRRLEGPDSRSEQWKTITRSSVPQRGHCTGSYCRAFGSMKYGISPWKSMERVSAYTVGRNIRQLDKTVKKLEINVFKSRNCKIRMWLPGTLISSSETDCYSVITLPQRHILDSNVGLNTDYPDRHYHSLP